MGKPRAVEEKRASLKTRNRKMKKVWVEQALGLFVPISFF